MGVYRYLASRWCLLRAGPQLGILRSLTFVAPFADKVEASLEQRIVCGRRGSGQGEDGGGEGSGRLDGHVFRVGFGRGGRHRGKNEVAGIGELPSVFGWGANEIAIDEDGVLLGVEMNVGEPEFAVGGAGIGAAGGGDVEVSDWAANGVDEGAGGWMAGVEMPGADQRRWRAKCDLNSVPAEGHEDGLDNKEGDGEDNFCDQDGDAPGAPAMGGIQEAVGAVGLWLQK